MKDMILAESAFDKVFLEKCKFRFKFDSPSEQLNTPSIWKCKHLIQGQPHLTGCRLYCLVQSIQSMFEIDDSPLKLIINRSYDS